VEECWCWFKDASGQGDAGGEGEDGELFTHGGGLGEGWIVEGRLSMMRRGMCGGVGGYSTSVWGVG
jgi:hypothetical protein